MYQNYIENHQKRDKKRNEKKEKMKEYARKYDAITLPAERKTGVEDLDALICISGSPLEIAENGYKAGFIQCMEYLKGSGAS